MYRIVHIIALALGFALYPAAAWSQSTTEITWHGHATFEITTPKGTSLMIDPWLNNPMNPDASDDQDAVTTIESLDYILITHGHFDHLGDAVVLAKKTGARLVTNFELGNNLAKLHGFPEKQMGFDTLMNIGGEITLADGEIKVHMTPAVHSSGMPNPKAGDDQPKVVYGGNPAGFVLTIEDGPTIYHTGDTAYFSDMSLIGDDFAPDIALINIGGHFGMEPPRAADAALAVAAEYVVPHHYGTFPVLTQDATPFAREIKENGMTPVVMKAGMSIRFEGTRLKR